MIISPLHVMQSAAGFYLGHSYTDGPQDEMPGYTGPWSRESEYFLTAKDAQSMLDLWDSLEDIDPLAGPYDGEKDEQAHCDIDLPF